MNLSPLLSFIRKHESRNDYAAVWGGIRKADRLPYPITGYTIRQVLAWQDSIDPLYMSEAAGGYQFLEDTLRDITPKAGISIDAKFDAATQDKLAIYLLKRRGLDAYMRGELTTAQFGNKLAQEWASLPCCEGPKKGKSYYAGDGLNKALTDIEPFMAVLRAVRETALVTAPQPPIATPTPAPARYRKGGAAVSLIAPQEAPVKSVIAKEAERVIRHALTPLAVAAVTAGWLPPAFSGPLVDLAVIAGAAGASLVWSKLTSR